MHSTAAFLSMPNRNGTITGGKSIRGFNDNTVRGYPLWLPPSTRQVSDVVQLDEDILRPKGGRHVEDERDEILDPEKKREADSTINMPCASMPGDAPTFTHPKLVTWRASSHTSLTMLPQKVGRLNSIMTRLVWSLTQAMHLLLWRWSLLIFDIMD